jgi:hypothetical protein
MGTARTCLIHGHEWACFARGLKRRCRYEQAWTPRVGTHE